MWAISRNTNTAIAIDANEVPKFANIFVCSIGSPIAIYAYIVAPNPIAATMTNAHNERLINCLPIDMVFKLLNNIYKFMLSVCYSVFVYFQNL